MNVAPLVKTFHIMKCLLSLSTALKERTSLNIRIQNARERAGLSVNKAADMLGVKRTQIWRMENQAFALSAERLFALADLYGVNPRWLYQGEEFIVDTDDRFTRIGDVVQFVEEIIQSQQARPSPDRVTEAIIEVLKRDADLPAISRQQPFDAEQHRGLVTLIFKKDV